MPDSLGGGITRFNTTVVVVVVGGGGGGGGAVLVVVVFVVVVVVGVVVMDILTISPYPDQRDWILVVVVTEEALQLALTKAIAVSSVSILLEAMEVDDVILES